MYRVIFENDSDDFLARIPKKHASQIIRKIDKLAENPHAFPHKKLR